VFFPGETISHSFVVPFAAAEIDYAIVSYKQNEAVIFEKRITSGFNAEDTSITQFDFTLTQEESLLFDDDKPFTIQVNIYTTGGTRHSSHEVSDSSGVQYVRNILLPNEGGS